MFKIARALCGDEDINREIDELYDAWNEDSKMTEVLRSTNTDAYGEDHEEYLFWCPGCKCGHRIIANWGKKSGQTQPKWSFNGDLVKPTFNPSHLVKYGKDMKLKCHSFIENGNIRFLTDCTHELAGKTVSMVPWEELIKPSPKPSKPGT